MVAVSVVSLGAAVGAWYYKYQLYGWLPSTASSELKNVDGLLMDKEGKPFTGRVKDISDSGYSLYAYKDGKLDGLNVVFSEGQLREIGHWENGEQNGLFEAWTDKGVLVDHGILKMVSVMARLFNIGQIQVSSRSRLSIERESSMVSLNNTIRRAQSN